MDEKTSSALAKRLAAYSATAGVALAVAPEASAQVVYHDIEPDVVTGWTGQICPFLLDVDDDGVEDFKIFADFCHAPYNRIHDFGGYYVMMNRAPGANGMNGAMGTYARYYKYLDFGLVLAVESGDVIGPVVPPRSFPSKGLVAVDGYLYWDYLFGNREGYAGFRFVAGDGAPHYGWIRLRVNFRASRVTSYEYAYESAPDTPIEAGAVSAALLDGEVNQTTFPAGGGTLVYTFTATNITDEPQPLDLWLDHYRIGHGPGRTHLLGSGTLSPGASVERSVEVVVPALAPEGTYDVRFKLGDFAERRFITFERFTITKEAATVGAGCEGAEPFAVAPVSGDLFGSAEAPASEVGATHALGEPYPNPSSGLTALTLSAVEAQAVRVEVLDALGRRVALLHDGPMAAGAAHRLVFDGSGLPSGVYVVRAVGEAFSDARVLTLTR